MNSDDQAASTFARRALLTVATATTLLYGVTVAICLPALDLPMALGVAALPAFFGGPFVGGLVMMIQWNRSNDEDVAAPDALASASPESLAQGPLPAPVGGVA